MHRKLSRKSQGLAKRLHRQLLKNSHRVKSMLLITSVGERSWNAESKPEKQHGLRDRQVRKAAPFARVKSAQLFVEFLLGNIR